MPSNGFDSSLCARSVSTSLCTRSVSPHTFRSIRLHVVSIEVKADCVWSSSDAVARRIKLRMCATSVWSKTVHWKTHSWQMSREFALERLAMIKGVVFFVSHPHAYGVPKPNGRAGVKKNASYWTREDAIFYTLSCERDLHTHATRRRKVSLNHSHYALTVYWVKLLLY